MEIVIIYVLIIIFSVIYVFYKKLQGSKSIIKNNIPSNNRNYSPHDNKGNIPTDIRYNNLPLLISNYSDKFGKIICIPKYQDKNNEVIKKALIYKWLKNDESYISPNEPIVELLIGRGIFKGTINYYGKLFKTKQNNDIIDGGEELCRLFSSDEKYKEYQKEIVDSRYKGKIDTDKYCCVLEMPFIDGKKANSVKITKWCKKSGDFVKEREIIGSHIINNRIEGIDHALKTGIIKIFKNENEYLKEGELVYEIEAVNSNNDSFPVPVFNMAEELKPENTKLANKTETNNNLSTNKDSFIKEESGNLDLTNTFISSKISTNSKAESQTAEYENQTHQDNIAQQTPEKIKGIENSVECKIDNDIDKKIPSDFIDVTNYDTSIEKTENENKINNVPTVNDNEANVDTPVIEKSEKKEILDIIKNDLFNVTPFNNKTPEINKEINDEDDDYPKNNFELRIFWLKLPRRYQNTFTDSIKSTDILIDEIYLKIINIYDNLYNQNGTNILKALKLNNKRILTLEKIRDEEVKLGYNIYYYNDTPYYNKILNIFYYTHRTAQLVLKLKYEFKVNIEENFFILSDLGLNKYSEEIKDSLIKLINDVPDPDEETEIEINKLNTARWKIYFNEIKEKKDNNANNETILKSVRRLIDLNRENRNIKSIYYNASKLLADISVMDSSCYYAAYKFLSFDTGVDIKLIPSALKKRLLKCGNGIFSEIENILASAYNLKTKRDNKKLLNDVQRLFKKERKTIEIDKSKVTIAEEEHLRIKSKLDELLSSEEQSAEEQNNVRLDNKKENIESEKNDPVSIDKIHKELIQKIVESGSSMHVDDLKKFALKYKLPYNYLVNSVNEFFYEKFDDNLIIEEDSVYILNSDYINEIKKLI